MKKKFTLLLSAILLLLLIKPGFSAEYHLKNPRSLIIEYRAEVSNLSSKDIKNFNIYLPLIRNNAPSQRVEFLSVTPDKHNIVKDSFKNEEIRYPNQSLKAGEKRVFIVKCKATIHDLIYNIDFNEFKKLPANPGNIYLKPQKYIESNSEIIKNTVKAVKQDEDNRYLLSLRIYDYLRQGLYFDFRAPCAGARASLENKLIACCDAALLYTAMCRAAGIPSRFCAGLYLGNINLKDGKEHIINDTHAWSEINLNNMWIPVDPTQGRFSFVRRFRHFAQQGNDYVTVWRDNIEPVRIEYKNKQDAGMAHLEFSAIVREEKRELPVRVNEDNDFLKDIKQDSRYEPEQHDKRSDFYINEAELLFKNGKIEESLRRAIESLRICKNSRVYNLLGYIYLQTFNYKNAYYYLQKSVLTNGRNNAAYENIINLFIYTGYYDKALGRLDEAEKKFPRNPEFPAQAGEIYLIKGQFDKSIKSLKSAIFLDNRQGYYFYLLGLAYIGKGLNNKDTARSCFDKAVRLGVDKIIQNNIEELHKKYYKKEVFLYNRNII